MGNPASTSSRRERQIAARLEQILDAAARLFAERGFHRTTTRDIAQAADVSEGTLYNYFENKNDLLFGILARVSDSQVEAGISGPIAGNARDFLTQMLDMRQEFLQKNSVMLQAILSEILADRELRRRYARQLLEPSLQAVEKNLALRIELGQLRPLNIPVVSRVLTSMWVGLFILDILDDPVITSGWDQLSQEIAALIFDGIAPRPTPPAPAQPDPAA